jgi:hypothetical protein
MRSRDRDGKWSTSTVLIAMVIGFAMGFLTCHEIYAGVKDVIIYER